MFPEFVYFQLLGSMMGSYLFSNLFAWLIKFGFRSTGYDKRLIIGGLITIFIGGILNAFGEGEGGFGPRLTVVQQFGFWFVWLQFYGSMSMLGVYFTFVTLIRKSTNAEVQ